MDYVDERAREAIDADGTDAFEEVRDRALVAMLAYSGVRGAEVLADYRDDRRNGLRWHSADLENGVITVLGKSQKTEETALPEQAVEPLRRLETLLDPPAEGWPVFPSRHPPSLYDVIADAGHEKPDGDPWGYVLRNGIEPPSMSTSGARTLLKVSPTRPTYLDLRTTTISRCTEPVGSARNSIVSVGPPRQRTLRHADPQTTSEMYSHIEASELAEDNTAVFDGE